MRSTITDEGIRQDIEQFRERISKAQAKLNELPDTAWTPKDRKKLKTQRKVLVDEIAHVKGLINIAEEALQLDEPNLLES